MVLQPNPTEPFRTVPPPIPIESPPPTLVQHNQVVLGDMLKLGDAEIAEFAEQGIIGTKPRLPKTN